MDHLGWRPEPEWVLLGCKGITYPCLLVACHQLHLAELRPGPQIWEAFQWGPDLSGDAELITHMNLQDMVLVEARTWQECLDELMRIWRPGTGRIQAIGTGQPALGEER